MHGVFGCLHIFIMIYIKLCMMEGLVYLLDAHSCSSGVGSTLLPHDHCMIGFEVMVSLLCICTEVSLLSLSWVSRVLDMGACFFGYCYLEALYSL